MLLKRKRIELIFARNQTLIVRQPTGNEGAHYSITPEGRRNKRKSEFEVEIRVYL